MSTLIGSNLRRAAELIRRRGHARNAYSNPAGMLDAVGAVRTAITGNARLAGLTITDRSMDEYTETLAALRSWLKMVGQTTEIGTWNDLSSTEDVINGLNRAAAVYELEHRPRRRQQVAS